MYFFFFSLSPDRHPTSNTLQVARHLSKLEPAPMSNAEVNMVSKLLKGEMVPEWIGNSRVIRV